MLDEVPLFAAVCIFSYIFYKWAILNHDYFKKRNLKFMKPHFLVGNTGGMFTNKYTATDFSQMLYRAFPDDS